MDNLRIPVSVILVLALTACSEMTEEKNYVVGATDESGGELIAPDRDPDEVPVELPETAMIPTAPEGVDTEGEVKTEG